MAVTRGLKVTQNRVKKHGTHVGGGREVEGNKEKKTGKKRCMGFQVCAESRAIDRGSVYIEFLELNNIEAQGPLPTFPTITIDHVQ